MITIAYKTGYITENLSTGMVRARVDAYAYSIEVKSVHAGKIIISKHIKNYGGKK